MIDTFESSKTASVVARPAGSSRQRGGAAMGHDETRARQTGTNKAQLKREQRQAERVEQARAEVARTARVFAIAGARLLDVLQATDAELEAAQDALAEVEREGGPDSEAAGWSAAVAEQVLEARDLARLDAEEDAADEAKGKGC